MLQVLLLSTKGGKIENIYWLVCTNKVMVSNPRNYVTIILTNLVKDESGDGAHKHLKLLPLDDIFIIGHSYRIVIFKGVFMEFSRKISVNFNKLISLHKAKGLNKEHLQPPNSNYMVKYYCSYLEKEKLNENRTLSLKISMRRQG